jgi:succinate dehydrogenase flavin-adding protein (antitoxin of CptAB toxin-antitoxin module)
VTGIKVRLLSARDAVRLVYRCWRTSRELGIPFEDVFEMSIATLEAVMWDAEKRRRRQVKEQGG